MTAITPEARDALLGIDATEVTGDIDGSRVMFTPLTATPFGSCYRLDIHTTKPKIVSVVLTRDAAMRLVRSMLADTDLMRVARQMIQEGR